MIPGLFQTIGLDHAGRHQWSSQGEHDLPGTNVSSKLQVVDVLHTILFSLLQHVITQLRDQIRRWPNGPSFGVVQFMHVTDESLLVDVAVEMAEGLFAAVVADPM
jgi:hypothetical protein